MERFPEYTGLLLAIAGVVWLLLYWRRGLLRLAPFAVTPVLVAPFMSAYATNAGARPLDLTDLLLIGVGTIFFGFIVPVTGYRTEGRSA
ncbi:hypothetical protein [uncultured Algimonas sp.]|uniref:hypothetical protein n=1 Tax=uncultured Algimonas sp. TaxID=1547920 RepID=UPI0026092123|nr:hypothetical protein [uncultured Algimonas sp.]